VGCRPDRAGGATGTAGGVVQHFCSGYWTASLETMNSKHDDQLALAHLALIDMERVQKSIEYLRTTNDEYLRSVLFRDAVISYAKPFTNNRFSDQSKGLRIGNNHVPRELADAHKEVLALRDELIAHTDMTAQKPAVEKYTDEVGYNFSMTVSGYEVIHKDQLVDPLLKLSKAVHASLIRGRSNQAGNHLQLRRQRGQ
jgi:hypothetical protein